MGNPEMMTDRHPNTVRLRRKTFTTLAEKGVPVFNTLLYNMDNEESSLVTLFHSLLSAECLLTIHVQDSSQ